MELWTSKQEHKLLQQKKSKMENGDYTPPSGGLANRIVTPQTFTALSSYQPPSVLKLKKTSKSKNKKRRGTAYKH